ncbi:glycosyltransferase family 4 protein [Galbibacter orientalis]|uniref:glycosyltransferase family 4 protein n=1 Tax=Galbibacter orientalis TaxID=453852 RepID=UPI00307FFE8B
MTKTILHLSNDFSDQKIYINLVRKLDERGYKQIVYVPLKWEYKINGNRDDKLKNVTYHYSYILKRNILFRLRYFNKINLILKDIENLIIIQDVNLIHAHFLFSDGGVAYLLWKKYGLPYVVSVRASDIYTFFGKLIHLRSFGNDILKNAKKIIFINESYKEIVRNKYLNRLNISYFDNNSCVIPNAISSYWFNEEPKDKQISSTINFLYVGRIIERKKLHVVIKTINQLNRYSEEKTYTLHVVGEGEGRYLQRVVGLSNENILFHGKILNRKKLIEIFKESQIFIMPSVRETFGLVYIEAMSQKLPIIYCKGEGVDGFFKKDEVGVAVDPNSVKSALEGVRKLITNYNLISNNAYENSKRFNWTKITDSYEKVYRCIFN